jgi:hypothetical protein
MTADPPAINAEVWAPREGSALKTRARVAAVLSATHVRVRDRQGREWPVPIASICPTVPSGAAGAASVAAQRATIQRGHEHLTAARRIAKGER